MRYGDDSRGATLLKLKFKDVKLSLDFENIYGTFWKHITYQIKEHRKSFPTTYYTHNFD